MSTHMATTSSRKSTGTDYPIIDCDAHQIMNSLDTLKPYLGRAWLQRLGLADGGLQAGLIPYRLPWVGYMNPHGGMRHDALPAGGGIAGSDPQLAADQLFGDHGIACATLIGAENLMIGGIPSPDIAAELMRAYNDWTLDVWLDSDPRWLGSIAVAPQDPIKAAAEIRRLGAHPRFVQIALSSGDHRMGHRFYDPIYEAAQEVNLPIAWHPGSESAGVNGHMTALSHPTSYIENNVSIIQVTQAHLTSLLTEGTFEKFPKLKVVFVEGGITWIPAVLWRLHSAWLSLRDEVPWMEKAPADYVKEHIRFTTQPLDAPADQQRLIRMLETFDANEILLYSSDYPHWNFDNPRAVLAGFPEDWKRQIFFENARDFYTRIPAELLEKTR